MDERIAKLEAQIAALLESQGLDTSANFVALVTAKLAAIVPAADPPVA